MAQHTHAPTLTNTNAAKGERAEQASQLFETMWSQWLTPHVITYSALISACANGERAEQASQLFETMQSHWLTPDVITYSSLISAGEKGGLWDRALQLFQTMQAQGPTPNFISHHSTLLFSFSSELSYSKIFSNFETCTVHVFMLTT